MLRKLLVIMLAASSALCLYADQQKSDPLEILLDINSSNAVSIGFADEAVESVDQDVVLAGVNVSLTTSISTLTATLEEPIYVYAQILTGKPCSLSVMASSMTGDSGDRLGWDIGTGDAVWLSIDEDESSTSYKIFEHDGEEPAEVYCVPLSVRTHSFEGKKSSSFSGSLTLIIADGIEGGSV